MLPVEAHATVRAPVETATAIPTVMPRSLNEPVGFSPSFLTIRRDTPTSRAIRGASWRPVSPSPSVTSGATGRSGR